MSSSLYSLGRWAARNRRWVGITWLIALLALGGVTLVAGGELDDGVSIPGTESQEALDTLRATFPEISGAAAQVLVLAPEGETVHNPATKAAIEDVVDHLQDADHVMQVLSPYDTELAKGMISESKQAALIQIQMDEGLTEVPDSAQQEIITTTAELEQAL
ncbi:MAG TPA: MMPL family transporter, partial [Beutenbergiaceae bacterium]|nr:MMPL family transporter [Beutenbergiaceae bacterium]